MIDWAKRKAVRIASRYAYAGSLVYYGCCTNW